MTTTAGATIGTNGLSTIPNWDGTVLRVTGVSASAGFMVVSLTAVREAKTGLREADVELPNPSSRSEARAITARLM